MLKKCLSMVIIMALIGGLVGCYFDRSKLDMELIDIKIFDSEANEIVGEYENFYELIDELVVQTSLEFNNVNSPAPVEKILCINAIEAASYSVVLTFKSQNNKTLTKLLVENYHGEVVRECEDIETIDNQFVVTITIDALVSGEQFFLTSKWYDGDGKIHYFSTMGGNTYLRGFYFRLVSFDETSCLS